MVEWVGVTIAARAVCGVVVITARRALTGIARLLDTAFRGRPTAQLFAVMIMCPLAMNMIQVRSAAIGFGV